MAKTKIDRDKLRVQLRRLRKDDLLDLLDRAIDLVPTTRLPALVKGYVKPEALRPDGAVKGGLLKAVSKFREASLRGEYYEDFMVNSKNYMEKSEGTETWIAECERLFDRCLTVAKGKPGGEAREAFDVLFGLLRHIDEGHGDVVFFADEGGSYEVLVEWEQVLPAYFKALAGTATPEEYAEVVSGSIKDFVHYDQDRYLKAARAAASPAQKKTLRGDRSRGK
ncbi:hypothetical protein ACFL59_15490 [Planctomycetota bacterium]